MQISRKIFIGIAAVPLAISLSACTADDSAQDSAANQGTTVNDSTNPSVASNSQADLPWGNHSDLDTFKRALDGDNVVILDVRTPEEYSSGHIPNSVNINVNSSEFPTKIQELDKDKTYAIYCRSGNRSRTAQREMVEAGFTKTLGLNGGIGNWDGPTD